MRLSIRGLALVGAWAVTAMAAPQMKWASIELLRTAAERGSPEAQFLLGAQYRVGDGVDRDAGEAAKWFRQAAESGYAEAQNALGQSYAKGEGVAQNAAEAQRWLEAAAKQGEVEAQYNLGELFGGSATGAASAVAWYEQAAQAGNVAAMRKLAEANARGLGTPRNAAEAEAWYRKAAALGDVEATFILVRLTVVRESLASEGDKTRESWVAEAEKGDLGALLALQPGDAVSEATREDPAETVRWSLLLSGLRGADAWVVRGYLLENGVAVNRNLAAAAENYRRAAMLGNAPAQFRLGMMYAAGRGVEADGAEAWAWLKLAGENGVAEAAAEAEAMRVTLTEREAGIATQRARSLATAIAEARGAK